MPALGWFCSPSCGSVVPCPLLSKSTQENACDEAVSPCFLQSSNNTKSGTVSSGFGKYPVNLELQFITFGENKLLRN